MRRRGPTPAGTRRPAASHDAGLRALRCGAARGAGGGDRRAGDVVPADLRSLGRSDDASRQRARHRLDRRDRDHRRARPGGDLPPARAAREPARARRRARRRRPLVDLHRRRHLDRGPDRLRGVDDVHGRRGGDARQRRRPDRARHRLAVVVERALPQPGSGAGVRRRQRDPHPGRPSGAARAREHRRDPLVLDSRSSAARPTSSPGRPT